MVVFSFLPFLATVAQLLGWAVMGRGGGRILEVVAGEGATVGSGKGMGVGVSGRGVASLVRASSSVRASICSLSASIADL